MRRFSLLIVAVTAAALCLAVWRQWISLGLTETLGFVTGLACVYLVVRENIWNFPLGIANNIVFLVLFSRARLYGDAGLQVVYLVLGFQGWYQWRYGSTTNSALQVARASKQILWQTAVAIITTTFLLMLCLRLVNGSAPLLDAFTTALSLGAQYLLNRKFIENWWVWILADAIYVWLYLARGLHLTAVLYGIFLCLCLIGWREWQRSLAAQSEPLPQ